VPDQSYELHGVRIFECDTEGAPIRNGRALNDLISAAWEHRTKWIVIPIVRLGDDFFRLGTGIAGEVVQKIAQYHLRLAILGDITHYVDGSTALRDFVRESNRGDQFCFVATREELEQRLQTSHPSGG
jgi:uncharacterized protein DUF4180